MSATAYLGTLNPRQRQAVEHGIGERDTTPASPLLVIASAGSGKTNTLAHRVAHLIVNGADLSESGYRADGLKVVCGPSWKERATEPRQDVDG